MLFYDFMKKKEEFNFVGLFCLVLLEVGLWFLVFDSEVLESLLLDGVLQRWFWVLVLEVDRLLL